MYWLLLLIPLLFPTLSEACSQYSSVAQDTRGNVISGASISVYIADTTTSVALYSDPGCTTVQANPITSDTDGTFTFFMNDGRVDITTVKTGYTFPTLTDVDIYAPLADNVVTVAQFTTTDICASSTGAIDTISGDPKTLVINKVVTCSTSKTTPSTLAFEFTGNGSVVLASGQTLTINGPVTVPHGKSVWLGTGTYVWGEGAGPLPYGWNGIITPTYDSSVDINNTIGTTFIVTVADANAFAIEAPAANYYGCLKIRLRNSAGGAIAVPTWNAIYKKPAFTSPANGQQRTFPFCYNGTNWVFETDDADTPN